MIKFTGLTQRVWILVTAFVLLATIGLSAVVAQEESATSGNGLRITPVRQEFILAPGQSESYEIEVANISAGDVSVITVVNDFESDDTTGQPRILVDPEDETPFSLRQYVSLPEPFTLEPGQSRKVNISVDLPEDANPGGYFGIVRFAVGIEGQDLGTIALAASVGSLLLVSVAGDVQEGMELGFIEARQTQTDNTSRGGSFFESAPDKIAINLKNTGNSILKPIGRVAIKNMFGKEVASYEFNGGQLRGNVLPQSSRTFEDSVSGLGRIGRYSVEANLSYGEGGGNLITAKTTFWIIPWKLLLGVLAILVLLVWFFTRGLKVYNRRIVERAKRHS